MTTATMARLVRWGALAAGLAAWRLSAVELDAPVFDGGNGLGFYLDAARRFERLRPDVGVRLYGDPRIEEKICVRIIGGSYPDLASAGYVPWARLIADGKVADLTPWLDGPDWDGRGRWRDDFLPGALDSWRIGGRIYGLPFAYSCWSVFYNRGLFRARGWREPRTWDEFFALCEAIRASGLAPLSLPGTRGLYPEAFLRSAFYGLAGADGWRALNDLAPGARTDPRYVRAAAILQRITTRYTLRGWEGETAAGAERAFLEGRAAMTVSGSWLVHETRGRMPAGFDLGAMNFPAFPGGAADPGAIQTGADSFFVFATGPERERAAVEFLRFLTSRARAEAFVRETDSPVAVRGVPAEAYSPRMRDTADLIGRAREAFNMPQVMLQPPALRQALGDERGRLMSGAIAPEEFGRRLEAAAARDRLRDSQPDRVELRHPAAGFAFLAALAAVVVWAIARSRRPRRSSAPDAGLPPMRARAGLAFLGPSLALYAAAVLVPAATAFGWSLLRWDGVGPRAWAGLFHFKWLLFESDAFWLALGNNLYLMFVPALAVVPVSLGCAALLHRGIRGAGAFRAIVLFPNFLGGLAATLLWLEAYQPHGGLVNAALSALGALPGLGRLRSFDGFPWLAPAHLYGALVPIYVWMACGFNLVLYLAAMEGIDPQLYEAAELDGAPAWRQFFLITLPLIADTVGISAVFLVIGGLNAFEMVWLLTNQDPGAASNTLATLLVTTLFRDFDVGRATALAVLLFLMVAAASAGVLRLFRGEARE